MTSAQIVEEILGFIIFVLVAYGIMAFTEKIKISKIERLKKAVLLSLFFTVLEIGFKILT